MYDDRVRSPIVVGVLTAIAAAVLFGIAAPVIAWASSGVVATACLLYLGAAIVGIAARAGRGGRVSLGRSDLPRLGLIALCGAAIAPVLLVIGLQRTGALTASLLLNLEAVFTVLIAARRETFGARVWIAVAAMATGGAALSLDAALRGTGGIVGALAVVGATLAWAVDNNLTQPLSARDPLDVVGAKATLGAALTGVVALVVADPWPSLDRALVLLACGALANGLSLALYILAQRRIGAARTGSVFALAPFIGALAAWLAGERTLGGWAFAAIVLFGFGVWLHLSEKHKHRHHHAALDHAHAHRHDDGHHTHAHDPPVDGEHTHAHHHDPLDHDHPHVHDDHHAHAH